MESQQRIGNFIPTAEWNNIVYSNVMGQNQRLLEENKNLKKEIEKLRIINNNFDNLRKQVQEENKNLQNKNSEIQKNVQTLKTQNELQRFQINKFTKEDKRMQNQIYVLKNNIQQLNLKDRQRLNQIFTLENKIHTLKTTNNDLKEKIYVFENKKSNQKDAETQTDFEEEKKTDEIEKSLEVSKNLLSNTINTRFDRTGIEILPAEKKQIQKKHKDKQSSCQYKINPDAYFEYTLEREPDNKKAYNYWKNKKWWKKGYQ